MSWNVGRIILWFYIKNYGYLISLDDYNEIKIIDFEKITLWIIVFAYPDISNVLVIRSSICLNFNEISFNDRNKLLLSFDNTSIIKMIKKSLTFLDVFPFNISIKEIISINFFISELLILSSSISPVNSSIFLKSKKEENFFVVYRVMIIFTYPLIYDNNSFFI